MRHPGASGIGIALAFAFFAGAGEAETSDIVPDTRWASGRTRAFVGGQFSAGAVTEARLITGYGKPHWTWAGLELGALTTTETGMTFARARLALVLVDFAVTWRRTWSYTRSLALRGDHHQAEDLEGDSLAKYGSIDAWAWGVIPAPFGLALWELEAVRVYGIASDRDVFEEYLRGIARPGWLASARGGYDIMFADGRALLGPLVELTWLGDRGTLVRVGPDFSWEFSPAWDLAARATVAVRSPDDLGFYAGLGGTLRLRLRWATGP